MQTVHGIGSAHKDSKPRFSRLRHATEVVRSPLFGFMLLLLVSAPVNADNFYVDNFGDGAASCKTPNNCTLRAALAASEANPNQSFIHLPNGSYKLKSALPPVTTQITIKGSDTEKTIVSGLCESDERQSENGHCVLSDKQIMDVPVQLREKFREDFLSLMFRVLEVTSTGKLTLNDLTVRGGGQGTENDPDHFGAGILNRGSVWLEHVTVMGNWTHFGTGGIANLDRGYLSLNNSTVRENFSHHGPAGGIFNDTRARVDITNSTISGNQVIDGFGGVEVGNGGMVNSGGGIVNKGVTVISASTISGNSGVTVFTVPNAVNGVGGILNLGEARLNGVSIAANNFAAKSLYNEGAGGVKNARGTFYVGNTIIAGNFGAQDCLGDLTSLRGNLVGNLGREQSGKYPCNVKDWSALPAITPVKPADVFGKREGVALHWNVFVAPNEGEFQGQNSGDIPLLNNNGGPTCTHALCTTATCFSDVNWARNKGWQNVPSTYPLACSSTDQRGVPRNSCDSGAFETVVARPPFNPGLVCSSITLKP
jgi:hypothetical protein